MPTHMQKGSQPYQPETPLPELDPISSNSTSKQ
jgi:hypothetical protein